MLIDQDNQDSRRELDEFHLFRQKKYSYLYFCPKCKRSFDSAESIDKCKTCSSDLVLLKPEQEATNYRYYCPVCEKNFTVSEKSDKCINCGSKFVHQYAWKEEEKTDKARMRLFRVKSFFRKIINFIGRPGVKKDQTQKKDDSSPPENSQKESKINNTINSIIEELIIEQSIFSRPLIRLNPFSRSEEMPTR
jgi:DNA-directed RNA polymerase subunit RPC12/RpoP